ncbi:ninja-family protein 2-like [Canna indica]|uniref:Ninja-family protein n=1 Tax=Canna indica TaxID=4628 RepID=A0AAQ3K9E8_9LILI|nr:ninja-family protein 2-like [Canna indica]
MEEETAKRERQLPSSVIESFPKGFLRRLSGNGCLGEQLKEVPGGDSEEVELNLGLSLGGCFGVDPKGKKLVRSSSIASFSSLQEEHEFPAVNPALVRTSSLPTDSEEERRKRKELQSLKRLEAKRKRLEKRSSVKVSSTISDEDVDGGKILPEPSIGNQSSGVFSAVTSPSLLSWQEGSKSTAVQPPISQGSLGVEGCRSFGKFESERQMPAQGLNLSFLNSDRDDKYSKIHSISNSKATDTNLTSEVGRPITAVKEEYPSKKAVTNGANLWSNIMGEMPCVSTRGDGPNGRRIEGFLYKYRKGEEIRIVCVCHGSFLTPAEFVKHAGGGDVAHPLRHIVVSPSPSM